MASGKGKLEMLRRGLRTVFFVLTMVPSLVVLSAPVLVAFGDVAVSLVLASRFACAGCYGVKVHLERYGFRSSLVDIPLVSVARCLVITCVYSLCDESGLSHGPYLGTVTLCSFASIIILSVKACVFSPVIEMEPEDTSLLVRQKLHLKSWGMSVMFLSSLVFALGHVVLAYHTSCRARRKLLYQRIDPEAAVAYKNIFSGYTKIPRSPTPCNGRNSKSESEAKRKGIVQCESYLPTSLLADMDSCFLACQGLTLHYKISVVEPPPSHSVSSSSFSESIPKCSPPNISPRKLKYDRSLTVPSRIQSHIIRNSTIQSQTSNLYEPLLSVSATSSTFFSDEIPALSSNDSSCDIFLPTLKSLEVDGALGGKFGVVLVHGFGGGVFSWRHVMGMLARQIGCTVVAFDRPGWGLTSRPRRKDWEERQLDSPYKLESQVDLLLSFCSTLNFSSVVLVGHDDGGLIVLKAAEKVRTSKTFNVEVKGVVLLSVSLSREVVPPFARIILHTSLGKKHMVRPLLRTEITQVINRHAWYDATKLTTEVLNLYKAPLYVEGWDEALHEIGRLSFSTVLSPQDVASLLNSIEDLPILFIAGVEDTLVPLMSVQAMASRLVNARLVAISGCAHLPHEECPKALLAALSPFISRLLSSQDQN